MRENLEIKTLSEVPDMAYVCAAWEFGEWCCLLGMTFDESLKKFQSDATNSEMPLTWVAYVDGKSVGMASLRPEDSQKHKNLSPWISNVFVHPFYRNQGIASSLVEFIAQTAKHKYNAPKIYLTTEFGVGMYERLGWKIFAQYPDKFGRPDMGDIHMERSL